MKYISFYFRFLKYGLDKILLISCEHSICKDSLWLSFYHSKHLLVNKRYPKLRYPESLVKLFPGMTANHLTFNMWNQYVCPQCAEFLYEYHINGSVQDCSNSIANALELLQSCTKPSILYINI